MSAGGQIGVVVPLVNDLYFSALLAGVAEAAYDRGLALCLAPTLHEHAREVGLREQLRASTGGTVIILPEESTEELARAHCDEHPIVVIDSLLALDDRVPSVVAAHRSGADQAMRHLLELGHRRIAAIAGPPGWVATEERRAGYRAALAGAGIGLDRELEVEADFEIEPGAEAAAVLLALPDPPTAIFAFNDAIAIGALRAAQGRGLRVPEDLSIVGYDDIRYATVVLPAMTTVRQPLADMGRTAVGLLARLMAGERPETPRIEMATRLVVRDSTARLNPR